MSPHLPIKQHYFCIMVDIIWHLAAENAKLLAGKEACERFYNKKNET